MNSKIFLLAITIKKGTEESGIVSIASFLRKYGYEVIVYSCNIVELNDDLWSRIQKENPKYFGVGIYDITRDAVYNTCKKVRDIHPQCTIFVGGPEAFCNPKKIIREEESINFVVSGEGERTVLELVQAIDANEIDYTGIKGLWYVSKGTIIKTKRRELIEDLNSMPKVEIDLNAKIKSGSILSSRGCRGNCSFCISPNMWRDKKNISWRGLSTSSVVEQIEKLSARGTKIISIRDSSYEDPSVDRMLEIAEKIVYRGIQVYYSVNFRPSIYNQLSGNDLILLKKSGLIKVFTGIEAFNANDLKLYNKGTTVEGNHRVLHFLDDNDIIVQFGFINFNPYSTLETLYENYENLKRVQHLAPSNIYNYCTALKLYGNTALYNKVAKDGLLQIDCKEGLGYRFADENVGKIACSVRKMFDIFSKNYGEIVATDLSNEYLDMLNILKRELSIRDVYQDLIYEINQEKEKTKRIIVEHFHKHDFFLQLIDLVKNNWDEEVANNIFSKEYNCIKHKQVVEILYKSRLSLWKKIFKRDNYCRKLFDLYLK